MKKLIMAVAMAATVVAAQDPVKVESNNGLTTVGVDVLSKPSVTMDFVRNNWGKLLLGVGAAVAVDRVADNNDWLWYEGQKKDKSAASPSAEHPQIPKPNPASTSQAAGGNASQTTINATDNSTVNITITGTPTL